MLIKYDNPSTEEDSLEVKNDLHNLIEIEVKNHWKDTITTATILEANRKLSEKKRLQDLRFISHYNPYGITLNCPIVWKKIRKSSSLNRIKMTTRKKNHTTCLLYRSWRKLLLASSENHKTILFWQKPISAR